METTTSATPLAPRPTASGFGWRVAVSVVSVFALVSFLLLYLAFWAGQYSGLQSAVVVIVAILIFIAANGAAWASWGTRFARVPEP